jgi:hypothetical protein
MIKTRRVGWAGDSQAWEGRRVRTGFWWENLNEITLGRRRRRWEDNIKMDLREIRWRVWTGAMWLRIEINDRHL